MSRWLAVVFCTLAVGEASRLEFPPDFKFGAATAAYQVEGAWNVSDKSPNVWDVFTHKKRHLISGGNDGDVACDSYHQWKRDVEMAHDLRLHFYRFSISWSRICPEGFCSHISKDGVAYYNNLIDGLRARGIVPVATLYHWDLPQRLQDFGGWANPLMVDWFGSYARLVFKVFGDRVKTWITINEPLIICDGVYNGVFAPGIDDEKVGVYLCSKNVLLAHAKAWRIYDEEFRPKYNGKISITNHLIWYEPRSKSEVELTELALQTTAGRFSHPIFSKEGGWPPALEKVVAENSKREGYPRTRLPPFTEEEKKLVRGTFDFYGVNYYTSRVVRRPKKGEAIGRWPMIGSKELGIVLEIKSSWKDTALWWLKANPRGLRDHLVWLKKQYGNLTFFVTENGAPSRDGLEDQGRVEFIKSHLKEILLGIKKDGLRIDGYTAWSLMDNFEWRDGYSIKFGLYEVNFTDPKRTRTPRASAKFYANLIENHALEMPEEERTSYLAWAGVGLALLFLVLAIWVYKRCRDKTNRKPQYSSCAKNDMDMTMKTN